jgi:hypothetical protein
MENDKIITELESIKIHFKKRINEFENTRSQFMDDFSEDARSYIISRTVEFEDYITALNAAINIIRKGDEENEK